MKNIYNAIKQTARKYALPAIMSGNIILASCDKNLPLNENVKESILIEQQEEFYSEIASLDYLVNIAESYSNEAKRNFNEGVQNKNLNKSTMEKILNNYNHAREKYSEISEEAMANVFWDNKKVAKYFMKKKGNPLWKYADIPLSKDENRLRKKCALALNGHDFGKADLQKDLEEQGLKVAVYKKPFWEDYPIGWAIFVTLIAGAVIGGSCNERKYQIENQEK